MQVQEIAFKSFENADELIDAIESLVDIARTCERGSKLTASEVAIDVRFEPGDHGIDLAVLNEETLTDGSKVYNILLS